MKLHNVLLCACGRVFRNLAEQRVFLAPNFIVAPKHKHHMQTITEVREYLKRVVGAKSTYRYVLLNFTKNFTLQTGQQKLLPS